MKKNNCKLATARKACQLPCHTYQPSQLFLDNPCRNLVHSGILENGGCRISIIDSRTLCTISLISSKHVYTDAVPTSAEWRNHHDGQGKVFEINFGPAQGNHVKYLITLILQHNKRSWGIAVSLLTFRGYPGPLPAAFASDLPNKLVARGSSVWHRSVLTWTCFSVWNGSLRRLNMARPKQIDRLPWTC